jgi:predicted porin
LETQVKLNRKSSGAPILKLGFPEYDEMQVGRSNSWLGERKTTISNAAWSVVAAGAIVHSMTAAAQSSVTLYGLIDTGVRYTTNAYGGNGSRVQLANGGESESHFGFRGSEAIGGRASVIFQLENRFFPNSGTVDPAYPFFNTAFIGVQSPTIGKLTLGRQLNPLADAITRTYVTNGWLPTFYLFRPEVGMAQGAWTSNMAKYAAQWRDLTVELSYAFGGTAGSFGAGSQIGASIVYSPALPFRLAAAYLDARDATNASAHLKAWTAGGAYTVGGTTLSAGWIVGRQDPAFTGNVPNGPFTSAQFDLLGYNKFSGREMFFGGVTQRFGAATRVSANVWRTLQTGKVASGDGNATQFQLLADYDLSKRTDVYVEADYSLYRGGLIGAQLQGLPAQPSAAGSTQLGISVGLRHQF